MKITYVIYSCCLGSSKMFIRLMLHFSERPVATDRVANPNANAKLYDHRGTQIYQT